MEELISFNDGPNISRFSITNPKSRDDDIQVNRDKVAISPRRADCNYHFPSRVGAVGQMQTGSRLGPP